MRWTDKVIVAALVLGIVAFGTACALFSFYDPIQAAFYSRAQNIVGIPIEWQFNFQHQFSDTGYPLYRFHNFLLGFNVAICALVASLVAVAVWLFRASRHPVPARTTHNTPLEVTWTIVPVIILAIMATWSFSLLRKVDFLPPSEVTLKVTGNQWFWSYAYPDNGGIQFSSTIIPEEKLAPEQRSLRLLAVDQYVVLPVNTVIRIQITASDVVHSWGVQSLGVKKEAGTLYLFASGVSGVMPVLLWIIMRLELQSPGVQWLVDSSGNPDGQLYNAIVSAHGLYMMFFVVIPAMFGGFGNYFVPLMIGAPDMAFPRLNNLSFWLFLAGGTLLTCALFVGNRPRTGWKLYPPFSSIGHPDSSRVMVRFA